MDDAALLAAVQGSKEEGLADFFEECHAWLYSLCMNALRNPHDATEAASRVLEAVAATRLRGVPALRPALAGIIHRVCVEVDAERRASGRQPEERLTGQQRVEAPEDAELRSIVWRGTQVLPVADRTLFALLAGDDEPPADVLAAVSGSEASLDRLSEHVRSMLSVAMVARLGREGCVELNALMRRSAKERDNVVRKRIVKHVDGSMLNLGCPTCGQLRDHWTPGVLAGLLPVFVVPDGARDEMLARMAEAARRRPMATAPGAGAAVAGAAVAGAAVLAPGLAGPAVGGTVRPGAGSDDTATLPTTVLGSSAARPRGDATALSPTPVAAVGPRTEPPDAVGLPPVPEAADAVPVGERRSRGTAAAVAAALIMLLVVGSVVAGFLFYRPTSLVPDGHTADDGTPSTVDPSGTATATPSASASARGLMAAAGVGLATATPNSVTPSAGRSGAPTQKPSTTPQPGPNPPPPPPPPPPPADPLDAVEPLTIVSPADGHQCNADGDGCSVVLRIRVPDGFDESRLSRSLTWVDRYSDGDGEVRQGLGRGQGITATLTAVGGKPTTHRITAVLVKRNGETRTATVEVTVIPPEPPPPPPEE